MVTEDYVSFETAKLLKEKGFDGKCSRVWLEQANHEPLRFAMSSFVEGEENANKETVDAAMDYANEYMFKNPCIDAYLCPTIQMAMKWLRDEKNLFIGIDPRLSFTDFSYITAYIYRMTKEHSYYHDDDVIKYDSCAQCDAHSFEEACERAIKYCLEHLVK